MVGHENTGGTSTVVLTFEFGWKLVYSHTQEKNVRLVVPVLGPNMLDQFLGGVNTVDVPIAFLEEHFGDFTSATADVKNL